MAQYCVHCGAELQAIGAFCGNCGKSKAQTAEVAPKPSASPVSSVEPAPLRPRLSSDIRTPNKKRSAWIWPAVAIGAFLLFVWWAASGGTSGNGPPSRFSQFTAEEHTLELPQKNFTVPAHGSQSFRFEVPEGAFSVRADGHFSASGGLGNDLEVAVMDADAYANWENRHQAGVYYSSGKVTQSSVHAILPNGGGTYYVVFSNRFSVFSGKQVEAQVAVRYSR
jgi:hypothetical protein